MFLQRIFKKNSLIIIQKFFSSEIYIESFPLLLSHVPEYRHEKKKSCYPVYPTCNNCKNYIKNKNDSLSTCKKQKYYNVKTDEMEYEFADYVRKNNNSCGHEGLFYESTARAT